MRYLWVLAGRYLARQHRWERHGSRKRGLTGVALRKALHEWSDWEARALVARHERGNDAFAHMAQKRADRLWARISATP